MIYASLENNYINNFGIAIFYYGKTGNNNPVEECDSIYNALDKLAIQKFKPVAFGSDGMPIFFIKE